MFSTINETPMKRRPNRVPDEPIKSYANRKSFSLETIQIELFNEYTPFKKIQVNKCFDAPIKNKQINRNINLSSIKVNMFASNSNNILINAPMKVKKIVAIDNLDNVKIKLF